MPLALAGVRPPLIGRRSELSGLRRRLERAGRGEGGIALVSGEPGIGKTRLLAEAAARAGADGWLVLGGRAYETEGMPPYLPVAEVLRAYLLVCPLDELRDLLGHGASEIARLVPEVRAYLPELPPAAPGQDDERYRVFESVTSFLLGIARTTPGSGLLLVLDDLQWADRPSLLLLQHLARRLAGSRLLVLAAYRTVEVEPSHPLAELLAALGREALADRFPLTPFSAEEVGALVAGLAGVTPVPAVAARIHAATEGNPFFALELTRDLLAAGCDVADAGAAAGVWHVPEGVRHVIERRLFRLSGEAQGVLRAAAVLGDGFAVDVLAATSGVGPLPLIDALDEAQRAGILREEDNAYHFSHALIRRTIYEGLTLARRQWLHRRAADALDSSYVRDERAHVGAVAAHYRLAGPAADPERALAYTELAAESADCVFAWEEAATQWQATLALLPAEDGRRRCDVLLALARARFRAGHQQTARETLLQATALARSLPAPDRFAEAALLYVSEVAGGTDPMQVALLEEARRLLGEEESALRARVLAQLAGALYWSEAPERLLPLARQGVVIARRLEDRDALAYALVREYQLLRGPDHQEERFATGSAILQLALETGDRRRQMDGHEARMYVLLERGDLRAFDDEAHLYARLSAELRQPTQISNATLSRVMRTLLDGSLEQGRRLARDAFEEQRGVENPYAERIYHWQLLMARWGMGWPEALAEGFRRFAAQSPVVTAYDAALAALYCESDRLDDARALFERVMGDDLTAGRRDYSWFLLMTLLAEACAALGDGRRAAGLAPLLEPYAGRNAAFHLVACFGAVDRLLGLLATAIARAGLPHPSGDADPWQVAADRFEAALAFNARLGAPCYLALTRRDAAAMLLARRAVGDERRAAELLRAALVTFDETGMAHDASRARVLLAAIPTSADRPAPYPDELSEREVEVLRLLAAGKSNRAIAEALVISVRTAEHHVASIYQKIGAEGATARAAATAYAFRHGLAHPPDAPSP
jgi:DNA-binding CsgD family transcriptional regulator